MNRDFGIDIGSDTIKIVKLEKKKEGIYLRNVGLGKHLVAEVNLESHSVLLKLAEAIKKLMEEIKLNTSLVRVSLPESSCFTKVIELPLMKESELTQAILWEAENEIPYPMSETKLDWKVLEEVKDQERTFLRILLVATKESIIERYMELAKLVGLEILSLENESLAASRALQTMIKERNIVLLDLGARLTRISLVKKGQFYNSKQIVSGGEAITRAIVLDLGLDFPVAEEYKKTYGLSNEFEGKIATSAMPVLEDILKEIRKNIKYFEEGFKEKVEGVILYGGSVFMPGLVEYLAKNLGIELSLADPFSQVVNLEKEFSQLKPLSSLFTVSFGLALRED